MAGSIGEHARRTKLPAAIRARWRPGFDVRACPGVVRGSMMPAMVVPAFWTAFVLTVVALALTLRSGLGGRRRAHLRIVPVTVALLVVTVLLAERMAGTRTFPPDEMAIHLWFAKSGALLVLPVAVTGLLLLRSPGVRGAHRVAVVLFLLGVLLATTTGVWVYSLSTPK